MSTNPNVMSDTDFLQYLDKFALIENGVGGGTIQCELVEKEIKRRIGELQGYRDELRGYIAIEKVRENTKNVTRSIKLVLNSFVPLQHPDPLSVLFHQVTLTAQATRFFNPDEFNQVLAKLGNMRCFADAVDFRHALANLVVVLVITEHGDIDVQFESHRQQIPYMGGMGYGNNVFAVPPHVHGGESIHCHTNASSFNQATYVGPEEAVPLATLPLDVFIEVVIAGDKQRVQLASKYQREADYSKAWDSRIRNTPLEILQYIILTNSEEGLVNMLTEVKVGKIGAVLQVFDGGQPPVVSVIPKRNY